MKNILFIFLLCWSTSLFANDVDDFFIQMKLGKYEDAQQIISNEKNKEIKQRLLTYYEIMRYGKFGELKSEEESEDELLLILDHLNNGYIYYLKTGNIPNAFINFRSAMKLSDKENYEVLLCEAIKGILRIYERFVKSVKEDTYTYFIDRHKKYAYDTYEKEFNYLYDYRIKLRTSYDTDQRDIGKKYRISNKRISKSHKEIRTKLHLTNYAYYSKVTSQLDSAYNSLNLAKKALLNREGYFAKEDSLSIKILEGAILSQKKLYREAINYLENTYINEADGFIFRLLNMYKNSQLSVVLDSLGDTINSDKYDKLYQISREYKDDIEDREIIFEMAASTQVEETKKESRKTFLYMLSLLILLSFITTLLLKNSRKRRLIAVQEKELETQRTRNQRD